MMGEPSSNRDTLSEGEASGELSPIANVAANCPVAGPIPRPCDVAITQALHLFWEHGYDATSLSQLKTLWDSVRIPGPASADVKHNA
jgi:hypothetical protein